MDIKGLVKPLGPLSTESRERVERTIRSEKSHDRDGNGQQSFAQNGEEHPPMSEEEFQKALNHLKNLPVVKENNLTFVEEFRNGQRFLILKEPSGRVLRRIAESELWTLQVVKDHDKGQLLSRSA